MRLHEYPDHSTTVVFRPALPLGKCNDLISNSRNLWRAEDRNFTRAFIRVSAAIFLSLGLTLLGSCEDSSPHHPYFPNRIGDRWIYSGYDSVAATSDSLTVTVTNSHCLSSGLVVNEWVYEYRNSGDTYSLFCAASPDSVIFYADTLLLQERNSLFLVPFQVGRGWPSTGSLDSVQVVGTTSCILPTGNSSEALLLKRRTFYYPQYIERDMLFAPEWGLTHFTYYETWSGVSGTTVVANQVWTLVSFSSENE